MPTALPRAASSLFSNERRFSDAARKRCQRMRLRFRAEFFNLLHHPNFGSPANLLTSALLGRSTQMLANTLGTGGQNGGFNPLYQIGGPRSIQLAMKLQF